MASELSTPCWEHVGDVDVKSTAGDPAKSLGVWRRASDGAVSLDVPCSDLILPPEALAALRELLDRAAMPGQPALDSARRPAAPDEAVSPSCNYEIVLDTRGKWVDVGADLGEVELDGHKLPLPEARELLAGLAASIRHCEWWAAENGDGEHPGEGADGG